MPADRPCFVQYVIVACALLGAGMPVGAQGQAASPAPATSPAFTWTLANTTRVESWRFFDPPATGGDPKYAFIANRLRIGVTRAWGRVDVGASTQYVQFGNLPQRASGPGALGTGALYYSLSGSTHSSGAYIRTLFARVRLPRSATLQAGRFQYQSGAEARSGRPTVETVKRARIDSRLVGEFEWSLYQRTFDGVRGDIDRQPWHFSAAWFTPTQGGFEDAAGARLDSVSIGSATFTVRPSVAIPATDLGVFALHYDDTRPVTARPDNTGISATRVDVAITTMGATAVGSAAVAGGEADWLVWFAGQTGSWYSQTHRAWSTAIESGYQWKAPWQPWLRGGLLHATGDADPADTRHGTFFTILPTVRKYSFTTAYAPMNLRDLFVEIAMHPVAPATVRFDARRLWLANAADRWYSGSGATSQRGSFFGYAVRPSGGSTDFGKVFEGAADITVARHWSINAFVGAISGGDVVRTSFVGDVLRYWYAESVIQF